jgi:hypothetical protein
MNIEFNKVIAGIFMAVFWVGCGPSYEPTGLEGRAASLAKEQAAARACEDVVRLIGEEPNRYWGEACVEAVRNNRSRARMRAAQAVAASALDLSECRQLASAFKSAANAPMPERGLAGILQLMAETLMVGCKGVDPSKVQHTEATAKRTGPVGTSNEPSLRSVRASPVSRTGASISLSAAGCKFVTVKDDLASATYLSQFKKYFGHKPGKLFFKPSIAGMTVHIVGGNSHRAPVALEFPAYSAVSFVATGPRTIPVHGTVLVLPEETRDIPIRPEVGGSAVKVNGVPAEVSLQVGRGHLAPGVSHLCIRSGQEISIGAGTNYKSKTVTGKGGQVVETTLERTDGTVDAPARKKAAVAKPSYTSSSGKLGAARFNMACSGWADSLRLTAARHRSKFMAKCLDRLRGGDEHTRQCLKNALDTNDYSRCVLR